MHLSPIKRRHRLTLLVSLTILGGMPSNASAQPADDKDSNQPQHQEWIAKQVQAYRAESNRARKYLRQAALGELSSERSSDVLAAASILLRYKESPMPVFDAVAALQWRVTSEGDPDEQFDRIVADSKLQDFFEDRLRFLADKRRQWQHSQPEDDFPPQFPSSAGEVRLQRFALWTLLLATDETDPLPRFEKALAEHREAGELLRLAYLSCLKVRGQDVRHKEEPLDIDFVLPLVETTDTLRRLENASAIVLAAEQCRLDDEDRAAVDRLWAGIHRDIASVELRNAEEIAKQPTWPVATLLRQTFRTAHRSQRQYQLAEPFLQVRGIRPDAVDQLLASANVDPVYRSELAKARTVDLVIDQGTVGDAVNELRKQTWLPIWVDSSVTKADKIDLRDRTQAIDALEQIAKQSGLQVRFFTPELVWLGAPKAYDQANESFRRGLGKLAVGGGKLAENGIRLVSLDYTAQSASDSVVPILDQLKVSGFSIEPNPKPIESLSIHSVPLPIAIDRIADRAESDWMVWEGHDLFGTSKRLAAFEKRITQLQFRLSRLDTLAPESHPAAEAVHRPVAFDFRDISLDTAMQFLSDYTGVPIRIEGIDDKTAKGSLPEFSLQTGSHVSMGFGLTTMTFLTGYDWRSDGKEIVVFQR